MLNEEVAKVIGENVRRYRKEKGYTQERLAEEANIDRTAISKLEKGKFLPTISFILAISQTLHIELIYFFIGAYLIKTDLQIM